MRRTWKFLLWVFVAISIPFLLCWSPASTISAVEHVSSFLVSAITSLSWLLFKGSAYLLVFFVEACRVAARGLHFGLNWATDHLRSLAAFLLNQFHKTGESAASAAGSYLKELGPKTASAVHKGFHAAMELAKVCIERLQKFVPEITKSTVDMVLKMLEGLWNNYLEALRFAVREGQQLN